MSNWTYKHNLTSNARVLITKDPDEPVTFAFPKRRTYWQSVRQSATQNVIGLWIAIHLTITKYVLAPYFFGAVIRMWYDTDVTMGIITRKDWSVELMLVGVIIYFFILPFAFTFLLALNKERFCRMLPKIGYYHSLLSRNSTKERIFGPKDITTDGLCIISSFSNVFLHYETSQDFKKYLKSVSITEHPYKIRHKGLFSDTKEINEHEFQAVFTFSQTPKTGKLKTHYI